MTKKRGYFYDIVGSNNMQLESYLVGQAILVIVKVFFTSEEGVQ